MQILTKPAEAAPPAPRELAVARPSAGRSEQNIAICEGVLDLAAALFDVCGKELRRPGRSSLGVARVRQIAMYATHVTLGMPMGEVGRGFGRDRTTVVHACHLIEDLREDPEFDRVVTTTERVVRAAFGRPEGGR